MNIANVTIAGASIGLNVRPRATVVEIADAKPPTVGSGSRLASEDDVRDAFRKGDFSSIKTGSYRPTDWIEELNQAAANEIDQAYWTREKRTWPLDVIGGHRHADKQPLMTIERGLRQALLDTERVPKDEESTAQPVNGDDVGSNAAHWCQAVTNARLPCEAHLFGCAPGPRVTKPPSPIAAKIAPTHAWR
jgi:hypothetical protein